MKKSFFVSVVFMVLSLMILPVAGKMVNSGKEQITITEEVLSGSSSAAAGVTLQMESYWDRYLFWNTEYTIGSGEEAKSDFTFSSEEVKWDRRERKDIYAYLMAGAGFGSAATYTSMALHPEDFPFPEMIRAVAERTAAGESHTETIRIGDYAETYSVDIGIEGSSVEYKGDSNENVAFLTDFFHISTAEDRMKLTTEKDQEGTLISVNSQMAADGEEITLTGASAFGETGCYYAYNCEALATGKTMERGQNSGIFYLPFRQEEGWLEVEVTQIRKVCDLPAGELPEGMLLDEAEGFLYLVVRGEDVHRLYIYTLEEEFPKPAQEIVIRPGGMSAGENSMHSSQLWSEEKSLFPALRQITKEDGGLMITWSDNGFAFITKQEGQYRLWADGKFPDILGQEEESVTEKPFPGSYGCVFDGKRLVLAAFEGWKSLNTVVAAYDETGEIYCGLYRHSDSSELYQEAEPKAYYEGQILPVGQEHQTFWWDRYSGELYLEGTDTAIRSLELKEAGKYEQAENYEYAAMEQSQK